MYKDKPEYYKRYKEMKEKWKKEKKEREIKGKNEFEKYSGDWEKYNTKKYSRDWYDNKYRDWNH